jgi:cleavage stimulation factor subunit 2
MVWYGLLRLNDSYFNTSPGVTDEAIVEIFNRVGQVLSYRALTDKETGKPRGYAFAEFADADAAASAVRNLNDFEIQGRKLRVDYANDKNDKDDNTQPQGAAVVDNSSALPPLPSGRDLGPNLTAEDNISKTLQSLPPAQLLDILQQMQSLVRTEPAKAQAVLEQSPQLSYAIFQSLLLLQLVDPASLAATIQATSAVPAQPPRQYPPPVAAPPQPTYAPAQQYPPQYPPQQYANTATPVAQPYPVPSPQPQVNMPQDPQQRAALVQQVLSLTQQQIDSLPPETRTQLMAVRNQFLQSQR